MRAGLVKRIILPTLAVGLLGGLGLLGAEYYFRCADRRMALADPEVMARLAARANDPWVPEPFQERNFSLIEPGLYVGGFVKVPPPGVKAVLNLCEMEDEYKAPAHTWMMIPDGDPAPSLDWLRKAVAFVAKERAAGSVTYIHCAGGVSRAGMVTTAYLMADRGWSRDEALAYIRKSRPAVSPNPAFLERLAEWERSLADKSK